MLVISKLLDKGMVVRGYKRRCVLYTPHPGISGSICLLSTELQLKSLPFTRLTQCVLVSRKRGLYASGILRQAYLVRSKGVW
jgi:hypothetical protein